jgi:hypothetical protein
VPPAGRRGRLAAGGVASARMLQASQHSEIDAASAHAAGPRLCQVEASDSGHGPSLPSALAASPLPHHCEGDKKKGPVHEHHGSPRGRPEAGVFSVRTAS